MNVFLDTSSDDFVLILFNNQFTVIESIHLAGYKKKVELITSEFHKLISKHKLQLSDIKGFYLNKGPGFFTGVRLPIVFFRTIALWLDIPMFTTNSFKILQKQKHQNEYLLNASGNKVYLIEEQNIYKEEIHHWIEVKTISPDMILDEINYSEMIKNFKQYGNIFVKEDPMKIEPLYIKAPQIGGH
ncbi:tRNA (adenosine(37)-N6)-threonylcarbamoyltransferase complex dimerization subunit type 1 TsaB [Mycoplasmopsis sturni]|uniref:tRNA (adenosine(37)-N6)-threonylcarbamoyltransferase complex dimerization subunit type 1 TsaB n=1 Tax=Mycoplasmopsis sturni TaxID=39047 RepID=UPI00056B2520|nr:tRNA (adenosine(37)-N6)-threonylcarbamoyltransferase complex dimerization subunit type 1 TsaB [Mycoplasmopsis sturni]